MTDRNYDKRVARSLVDIAERELGKRPKIDLALRLVQKHRADPGRPKKREEYAAWLFEKERRILRCVPSAT